VIDLHLHSRFSDGLLTPAELVERARLRGVTAIALTDHDTLQGNEEALLAGERLGVKVISGVEFSVEVEGAAVHILGYGASEPDEHARSMISALIQGRESRLAKIVARINDLGIPISSAEVRRESGTEVIGRLHIARVLLRHRAVGSVREAFTRYLGRGAAAFVDRPRLSGKESIDLIHSLGAVAVLAHPGVVERENQGSLAATLDHLIGDGLDGLEAYYSTHTLAQTQEFVKLAAERGLLVTGGSDFHRPESGGPDIGSGTGRLKVPQEALDNLEKAIALRRSLNQAFSA